MATFYETIYRPPTEAGSLLLEVSVGCSYGKCTFCRLSDGSVPLQLASPRMLADSLMECDRARIFKQMQNGVFVRMAVLERAVKG